MIKSIHHASVEITVPFHDVDMMEVVWHGHYTKYFEVARCVLLDRIDYNYPQMRESGYSWPVIDLSMRYIKPAMFGQIITVQADIVEKYKNLWKTIKSMPVARPAGTMNTPAKSHADSGTTV